MTDIDCTLTPPVKTVIPLDIVLDTEGVGVSTGLVQLTEPLNPPVTTTVPLNIDFDPDCIGLATGVVELTAPLAEYSIDLGFVTETSGLSGVVELTAPIHDMTIDVHVGKQGEKGDPGEPGPQGLPGLDGVSIIHHGDDANYPRPVDPDPVVWEGSVLPVNWQDGDIWINPETDSTPIYAASIQVQDLFDQFAGDTVEEVLMELKETVISPNAGTGYTHTQNTESAVWTVQHNLGFKPGGIVLLDINGNLTFGWSVTYSSTNVMVLTFPQPIAGTVHVS